MKIRYFKYSGQDQKLSSVYMFIEHVLGKYCTTLKALNDINYFEPEVWRDEEMSNQEKSNQYLTLFLTSYEEINKKQAISIIKTGTCPRKVPKWKKIWKD